jgi:DNA-binding CsgD family transcriptional regulator
LRAALRWWIESQDGEKAVQDAAALFPIWYLRGSLSEGRSWLEEVLALPAAKDAASAQERALYMFHHLARRHGEYSVALDALSRLLTAGDARGAALTLVDIANVHYQLANYPAAWASLGASRAAVDQCADQDPYQVPLPTGFSGKGRLESEWRFIGGQIALHEGRYDLARALLAEELEAGQQTGGPNLYQGYILKNLGGIAIEQRQDEEGGTFLHQALQIAAHYGDRTLLAHVLEQFSALASVLDDHERAMCLGGAAAALREAIGSPISPAWRRMGERWLAVSRAALGDDATAATWRAGQEMSLKQAIELAQAPSGSTASPGAAAPELVLKPAAHPLTRREREVAALIAQGLSNRRIAEHLVITERTVAAHVEHILDKLAFGSRTQIGVWAAEHDLVGSTPA